MLNLIWFIITIRHMKNIYIGIILREIAKCILLLVERSKEIDRRIYSESNTIKPSYLGHVDYLFDDKVIEPISNVSRLPSSKTRRIERLRQSGGFNLWLPANPRVEDVASLRLDHDLIHRIYQFRRSL